MLGNVTIDSTTGALQAINTGEDAVIYTLPTGCSAYSHVMVSVPPTAITGDTVVCHGEILTLTESETDGTWTSSDTTVANLLFVAGASAGFVCPGVGTAVIGYSNFCGTSLQTIHVDTLPHAGYISGTATLCQGTQVTLSASVPGGVWSSVYDTVATNSLNVFTGVSGGLDVAQYRVSNVCGADSTTYHIFVNSLPVAGVLVGLDSICLGGYDTLFTPFAAYAPTQFWYVSNTDVVNDYGNTFHAEHVGTDTLTFFASNDCGVDSSKFVVNVKTVLPVGVISGTSPFCAGTSVTLSDPIVGGIWSSSDSSVAIPDGGVATAFSGGSAIISYTMYNSCGGNSATFPVSVTPLPFAGILVFTDSICLGTPEIVMASASGGILTASSNFSVTADTITALTSGAGSVTYTVENVCGTDSVTMPIYVRYPPVAGAITGVDTICVGAGFVLSDSAAGGVWASSPGLDSVSYGHYLPSAIGIDTVTYTVTLCGTDVASKIITVIGVLSPGTIAGLYHICTGSETTLTDSAVGGMWSASNGNITVSGGVVTGVTVGMSVVSYSLTNMCGTTTAVDTITVETLPTPAISMPPVVCAGDSVGISGLPLGGTWMLTNGKAYISGTTIKGVVSGTDSVFYTVTNDCGTGVSGVLLRIDTVLNPTISGLTYFCIGSLDTLSGSPASGTWAATDTNLFMTAGIPSGIFDGSHAGHDTLLYTVTNACGSFTDSLSVTVFTKAQCDSLSGVGAILQHPASEVEVYPNPASGWLHISCASSYGQMFEAKIINAFGQLVWQSGGEATGDEMHWDVSFDGSVATGTYYIVIKAGDRQYFKPFVLLRE